MVDSLAMQHGAGHNDLRPGQPSRSSLRALELERDLYQKLIELAVEEDVEAVLSSALQGIAELASAKHAYLELRDPYRPSEPKLRLTYGVHERAGESFAAAISSGVVQDAIASGETIVSLSAFVDPRFQHLESVRRYQIAAVLCAAIGRAPTFGVLYLEGRTVAEPFTEIDRKRSERCANQLAMLVDRLLLRRQRSGELDAGSGLRARLLAGGVVGQSSALNKIIEQMATVSQLDVSVLFTGPTGSGKSVLAEALHANSRRARGPFVELNCAALPDALFESELFGASRGAHSAATAPRIGKIAAAEGGTLFLDEVGELSLFAQAKLLQVLQSKRYYALGSNKLTTADVRVVAATNRDLAERVKAGAFREDLFYRLRVFPIHVPGLDERPDDVPVLARNLVARACTAHGWPTLALTSEAMDFVRRRPWPGNVRELASVLEVGAIRATVEHATRIELRHLTGEEPASLLPSAPTLHEASRRFQRALLKETLEAVDWNAGEAALRLGIARSYLYKLMNVHGLRRGS